MLDDLFARDCLSIRRGSLFDRMPGPVPLDDVRTHRRIEGMILGLAVGDALGHSTEYQYDSVSRHREYGTIVDHVGSASSPAGRISDDTQMSLWTLERLLETKRVDPLDLARCFAERRDKIVGMGKNTRAALSKHRDRLRTGEPLFWECAGDPRIDGRGNGGLMRFSPLLLPHLRQPSTALWGDVTLATLITHGHAAALSSVLAFTYLLWEVLRQPAGHVPAAEWWLDEYVRVAHELETQPLPYPLNTDPIPAFFKDFRGTLWQFVDSRVRGAWRQQVPFSEACSLDGFGSRADTLQTVPTVLYLLMSHADSFESAIIAAVNDTKDNDTIASIAGAILGALHGRRAIRQKWVTGIRSRSLSIAGGLFADDRSLIEQFATDAAATFG